MADERGEGLGQAVRRPSERVSRFNVYIYRERGRDPLGSVARRARLACVADPDVAGIAATPVVTRLCALFLSVPLRLSRLTMASAKA